MRSPIFILAGWNALYLDKTGKIYPLFSRNMCPLKREKSACMAAAWAFLISTRLIIDWIRVKIGRRKKPLSLHTIRYRLRLWYAYFDSALLNAAWSYAISWARARSIWQLGHVWRHSFRMSHTHLKEQSELILYTGGLPVIRKVLKTRIWGVPPACLGSR